MRSASKIFAALVIGLVSLITCLSAQGQTGGRVSGIVRDPSGAAIVGAGVNLRNSDSGAAKETMAGSDGSYVFEQLPDGNYAIAVEAKGFQKLIRNVTVSNGTAVNLVLDLKVEKRQEVVTVVTEDDYSVPTATTATKMDTPLLETPFAVQVVPNSVIEDQQAIRLQDITRNVSGVQTNFGYGDLYQAFALRGFETNVTLRNGERVSGGIGRSEVEVADLESVEVLKGPAAMLYGRLEPGGMINVVTKKPLETPHYSLQQQFGSFDMFRTTFDATGPILHDGSLLYRTVFTYFNSDDFITYAPHGQTIFVAPSLSWRPTKKLTLNLNVEWRDADPLIANGIPAIGNRPADIPTNLYLGGDVGDRANVRRKVLDFNGSYELSSNWKLHGLVAGTFDDIDFEQFFGGSLDESPGPTFGDFTNIPWFDKRRSKGVNTALDLTGHFRTPGMNHNLLVGTDYYYLDFSDRGFVNGWAPVDTMNVFHPEFRRPTAFGIHDQLAATAPDWTSIGTTAWHGLYVQDRIGLGRYFHVLVGGRYDWTHVTAGSITLEYANPGSTLSDVVTTPISEDRFSPVVGFIFQPVHGVSFYANYVSSLGTWGTSNVIAVDINGHPLPAQRSHSYEGGIKLEAMGGKLTSTLAIFDLTKTNIATRDLSSPDPTALRAIGEAHSSGVEVDISGALTKRLSLIGSYAYTNAEFSKDNSGLQGLRIANVPRHSGSVWLRSDLLRDRLAVGAGAFLRGPRQGDNENTFTLPGYATVDAYLAYTFRRERHRVTPQVNFSNLLDKRYFINTNVYDAYPRLGIMPGQPFAVTGSIRWEF
ncbi:MAG TPA: TonB-dependent receptor [Terriglobales bacterium]|nr:TonB-dependent receptor [Terriglobales bacterium]